MLQQETDEVMESEDGCADQPANRKGKEVSIREHHLTPCPWCPQEKHTPTDDEEVTIPSQDKYKKVPDILNSDIRDEQTLSNTQREDWLLPTEPMHGARPRQTGRERPPVIDNPALRDAAGNTAVRNPSQTFLLSPGQRISREEEVFTPPRGAVRSLSLRVYHVRYELYQNLFRRVIRKTSYEMAVRTLGRRWIC